MNPDEATEGTFARLVGRDVTKFRFHRAYFEGFRGEPSLLAPRFLPLSINPLGRSDRTLRFAKEGRQRLPDPLGLRLGEVLSAGAAGGMSVAAAWAHPAEVNISRQRGVPMGSIGAPLFS